jgi:hypothetical protein
MGKKLATFNLTFTACIPNNDNLGSFDEYEEISLCNCVYKIIAKIVVMMVKKILSK